MLLARRNRQSRPSRSAWAATGFSLLASVCAGPAPAQPSPADPAAIAATPAAAHPIYHVGDCVAIALQKQPSLAAARASLAAKQAAAQAVGNIRAGGIFAPDLEFRKLQARHGVQAAHADLLQQEYDVTYNVTRNYFTAVYANTQVAVAEDVITRLEGYRARVADIIQTGVDTDFNKTTLERLELAMKLTAYRKEEANAGIRRALVALREAMGVGNECLTFQLADSVLPVPTAVPERCQVITAALARRGEIMKALVAADVGRLEIDAQCRIVFSRVARTFASGADIHATPIPAGDRGPEYRPAAVAPEMPANLAGNRADRVTQAKAYAERADAVTAKVRELVTLEAEDALLKWQTAREQASHSREASRLAVKLADETFNNSNASLKVRTEDILSADVLAGQARAAYQEARYREILALVDLERITAGGFTAGLAASPSVAYSVESR